MNNRDTSNNFGVQVLTVYQAEFVAKFFGEGSSRIHLLLSPPGSGKSVAITTIVRNSIDKSKVRRILFLTMSSVLVHQWAYLIKKASLKLPVEILDRRRFRDLEFSKPSEESPFIEEGIVIITANLARQKDVAQTLKSIQWDLLVVDEAHILKLGTQIGVLIENLLSNSSETRGILLGASARWGDEQMNYLRPWFESISVTKWSYQDMRLGDGHRLVPDIRIELFSYHRSQEEIQFLESLQEALSSFNNLSRLVTLNILQAASSSLFALGQRLRRLRQRRNEAAHGQYRSDEQESVFENIEDNNSEQSNELNELQSIIKLGELVIPFIGMVEDLPGDSKFEVLGLLLEDIVRAAKRENRICILTGYADTANFLTTALSERFDNLSVLTGQRSFQEREEVIKKFREEGGILIATWAVATSTFSPETVIFYDVPVRQGLLEEHIGIFVSANVYNAVRFIVLADESQSLRVQGLIQTLTDGTDANDEESLFRKNP